MKYNQLRTKVTDTQCNLVVRHYVRLRRRTDLTPVPVTRMKVEKKSYKRATIESAVVDHSLPLHRFMHTLMPHFNTINATAEERIAQAVILRRFRVQQIIGQLDAECMDVTPEYGKSTYLVVYPDSMDRDAIRRSVQFCNKTIDYNKSSLLKKLNKAATNEYIENLFNQWGFVAKADELYDGVKYQLRMVALKKTMANFRRVVMLVDLKQSLQVRTSDNPNAKKMELNKIPTFQWELIQSFINNTYRDHFMVLKEVNTQATVVVAPRHATIPKGIRYSKHPVVSSNATDAVNELFAAAMEDPIKHAWINPDQLHNQMLMELAKLYDIDVPHQTHIQYRGYRGYTNMYPRFYPHDASMQQLQELVEAYKEYGIITPEETRKRYAHRKMEQAWLRDLNHDLRRETYIDDDSEIFNELIQLGMGDMSTDSVDFNEYMDAIVTEHNNN